MEVGADYIVNSAKSCDHCDDDDSCDNFSRSCTVIGNNSSNISNDSMKHTLGDADELVAPLIYKDEISETSSRVDDNMESDPLEADPVKETVPYGSPPGISDMRQPNVDPLTTMTVSNSEHAENFLTSSALPGSLFGQMEKGLQTPSLIGMNKTLDKIHDTTDRLRSHTTGSSRGGNTIKPSFVYVKSGEPFGVNPVSRRQRRTRKEFRKLSARPQVEKFENLFVNTNRCSNVHVGEGRVKIKKEDNVQARSDVLNEYNSDEWDMIKGYFLDICIEELMNNKNEQINHYMVQSELVLNYGEGELYNTNALKRKELWNKWIKNYRHLLDGRRKEPWFQNLKFKWINEMRKYIDTNKNSKRMKNVKCTIKNPILEKQKVVWKNWFSKEKHMIKQYCREIWFKELIKEYEGEILTYSNADEEKMLITIMDSLRNKNDKKEFNKCLRELLTAKAFVLIYMMVLEDCMKNEYSKSNDQFLDPSFEKRDKMEYLNRNLNDDSHVMDDREINENLFEMEYKNGKYSRRCKECKSGYKKFINTYLTWEVVLLFALFSVFYIIISKYIKDNKIDNETKYLFRSMESAGHFTQGVLFTFLLVPFKFNEQIIKKLFNFSFQNEMYENKIKGIYEFIDGRNINECLEERERDKNIMALEEEELSFGNDRRYSTSSSSYSDSSSFNSNYSLNEHSIRNWRNDDTEKNSASKWFLRKLIFPVNTPEYKKKQVENFFMCSKLYESKGIRILFLMKYICHFILMFTYPLYNLIKRKIRHENFINSSYFFNLFDFASGMLSGALFTLLYGFIACTIQYYKNKKKENRKEIHFYNNYPFIRNINCLCDENVRINIKNNTKLKSMATNYYKMYYIYKNLLFAGLIILYIISTIAYIFSSLPSKN
ncbi:conserved Plasmodium protein, unknown function [Plasmodium malariae]|uniref:STP1 protein n=1 Tax=Plasmodium malariae TaxID=5858 RepID=A0A1D3RJ48_PLAMA|nr:conserved Plasmodium protein, unknown function [Plasmodium malariae]SCN44986.1 conserved Plasmodium protein, unknown function [Plasmodium malariae]